MGGSGKRRRLEIFGEIGELISRLELLEKCGLANEKMSPKEFYLFNKVGRGDGGIIGDSVQAVLI
jgi:hypothetical protein